MKLEYTRNKCPLIVLILFSWIHCTFSIAEEVPVDSTPISNSEKLRALRKSCEFYLEKENIQPCGPNGYFLRFGFPYCNSFFDKVRPEMSEEGARWLDEASHCLRIKLDQMSIHSSCKELENQAIASHSECYTSTGFCEITLKEKMKVFHHIGRELSDFRFFSQFMQTLYKCSRTSDI